MYRLKIVWVFLLLVGVVSAQEHFPKNDGVKSSESAYTALTNAKIYITPSQVVDNGTLLIQKGKVVASGVGVNIPNDAIIIDLDGKSIYPSFIEVFSGFGVEKPKRQGGGGRSPQYDASREGFYWNDHVMPEQNAVAHFKYNQKSAAAMRKAGYGVVNTHMQDGIIRGTGALVALTDDGGDGNRIINPKSAQYISTRKSVKSRQSYPTSIMGTFAMLRQVHSDAAWYAKGNANVTDRSLEAYNANKGLTQIVDAGSKLNVLRFAKVGNDIGVNYVIVGGGDEYENVKAIKNANATLVLPLDFPKPFDVENTFLASTLELEAMREWNQKPGNAKVMAENNVAFAFTTNGLSSPDKLQGNLMKAINYGLDKTKALEALTSVPAKILQQEATLGHLKKGAYANFLISSGDIFEKSSTLYENWVKGERHIFEDIAVQDLSGTYTFTVGGKTYEMNLSGSPSKPKAKITAEGLSIGSNVSYSDDWLNVVFATADTTKQEMMRLVTKVSNPNNLSGKVVFPNGSESSFFASKKKEDAAPDTAMNGSKEADDKKPAEMLPVTYPNGAYGFSTMPKQETLLFKNATVWTNEADGILENTDVLIKNGKIAAIGSNLSDTRAKVIDATGKHLTAGIIDEHSHIAAASINEAGQNSSAEVTIEDVIDPEDIDIYRNLAGGVTGIQILHGSANPIGGRSAVIKLKWGETAEQMINKDAAPFIKFALGENVKQSNWQSYSRFPQTRMGVEQIYMDYFARAKAYDEAKKAGKPYRQDTELEVLAEILNKERFISCHSYVQSEINMLMKVAEKFNFNINTFTHILEGYKVADKMAAHGVAGSTFSDWWAYKYEVNDAIPYNAAIMHDAGVLVAINSDDGEMSRRLNQEAAKSVKYGGVSEEDAWKFVTLNPAKMLHIDDNVGSLKVGKDADVVLWTDHPMSIYAKAEKTIIEGVTYFDLERDMQMRKANKAEKAKITAMMLKEKNKGVSTQPIKRKDKVHMHCDSEDYQTTKF